MRRRNRIAEVMRSANLQMHICPSFSIYRAFSNKLFGHSHLAQADSTNYNGTNGILNERRKL